MFKIQIIAVGKNKDEWVKLAVNHYLKLLNKYCTIDLVYSQEIKKTKNRNEAEVMKSEAKSIIDKMDYKPVYVLDDAGKSMNSMQFSKFMEKISLSESQCAFIIGGAYGLDKSLVKDCRDKLSLSPMTMSHQLIRPVLLEQLYRAFSIISGSKYHK